MQSITANLSDMAFRGIDDNFSVPFSQAKHPASVAERLYAAASKQASKQAFIFNKGLLQSASEDCGITKKAKQIATAIVLSLTSIHRQIMFVCVFFFVKKLQTLENCITNL